MPCPAFSFLSLLWSGGASLPPALAADGAQAAEAGAALQEAAQAAGGAGFLEAILSAHIIVQATMIILALMSVVSWGIILQKWSLFQHIKEESGVMEDVFLKSGAFETIYNTARSHESSPLARVFISGYNEMQKILSSRRAAKNEEEKKSASGLDNVERALKKGLDSELSLMEEGLGFLATTGSSCPFIGLFGTVFGIMNSFNEIARMGSASLHIVAPGIAEALIATGLGLFAAIPASVFYNIFLGEIRKWDRRGNNFSTDFINIAGRNFFQEK